MSSPHSLPVAAEHSETFLSPTTLLGATLQRKVATTVRGARGCVQRPLRQNKLVRAAGVVRSPETFAAIFPPLSKFDKLWALHHSPIHHLLKVIADQYAAHIVTVWWPHPPPAPQSFVTFSPVRLKSLSKPFIGLKERWTVLNFSEIIPEFNYEWSWGGRRGGLAWKPLTAPPPSRWRAMERLLQGKLTAQVTSRPRDPPDCFSMGESAGPSALQLEQIFLTAHLSCVSATINIHPFKETSEQDKKKSNPWSKQKRQRTICQFACRYHASGYQIYTQFLL